MKPIKEVQEDWGDGLCFLKGQGKDFNAQRGKANGASTELISSRQGFPSARTHGRLDQKRLPG